MEWLATLRQTSRDPKLLVFSVRGVKGHSSCESGSTPVVVEKGIFGDPTVWPGSLVFFYYYYCYGDLYCSQDGISEKKRGEHRHFFIGELSRALQLCSIEALYVHLARPAPTK